MTIRIATRESALALWQAQHVGELLGVAFELVLVRTEGDRRLDRSLQEIGGQGVFVKEVQRAIIEGRADIAVHSAKDLPTAVVEGLTLAATPQRGDPRDALVGSTLASLPSGGVVASSSSRRISQLLSLRPDLKIAPIRGNIHTRLEKAKSFDALLVSVVALQRLGLSHYVAEILPTESFCPQVGQGSLAVECRSDDERALSMLELIDHRPSHMELSAERSMLERMGAGCTLPVGGQASYVSGELKLTGFIGSVDGKLTLRASGHGTDALLVGRNVGESLLSMGGAQLLAASFMHERA